MLCWNLIQFLFCLAMKKKILLYSFLLIFLPIVTPQSTDDIKKSIGELNELTLKFHYPENYSEFYHSQFEDGGECGTYDFIIIGAGSAGTVLANRLSEVKHWKILLLEAGQDDTLYTDIPAMAGLLQFTNLNWAYRTVPQKNCCLGMKNNQCNVPRGKVLGGSSTLNYMIYVRGNRADYDAWSAAGNPGWSYDEVLPYFMKSENSSLTELIDEDYHGKNGTLHVEHVRHFGPLGQAVLDGYEELGENMLDYNGKDEMGFSKLQSNTINGRRCSGNKAFLQPALKRKQKNLKVQKGAFVTKLYSNKHDKNKISGVEFLIGNKKYYAKTKKEVILSAGAIGSPQILMHSGIGPKEHLESLGIKVIADLPVGQNLHDHCFLLYPYSTNFIDPGLKPIDKMVEDYRNGHGYFTNAANLQSIGFVNTKDEYATYPDIEHLVSTYFDVTDGFIGKAFNYKDETITAYLKPFTSGHAMISIHVLLHPKSRGSVTLKSKNPFDHPSIDLNYFSDPDDLESLVNGLKDFFALTKTESMKKFNVTIENNPIPECPQDDDYLECMARHMTSTLYHQAGTCKMGPDSDPEAVVNARLKVRGMKNLRVIDASIMPTSISGHTNAASYMIAEKGSDLIKQDWRSTFTKV